MGSPAAFPFNYIAEMAFPWSIWNMERGTRERAAGVGKKYYQGMNSCWSFNQGEKELVKPIGRGRYVEHRAKHHHSVFEKGM